MKTDLPSECLMRARYLLPRPETSLGRALQSNKNDRRLSKLACIDLSDAICSGKFRDIPTGVSVRGRSLRVRGPNRARAHP